VGAQGNWKGFGKKRQWSNLRYYPGIHVNGLSKIKNNLGQENEYAGLDLNPVPAAFEAGLLLTTRPRRSVGYPHFHHRVPYTSYIKYCLLNVHQ
jgi:hypothetical protein